MNYNGNKAENLKIAYIGGGSRGWAWMLMSDLALEKSMSGKVYLYDINYEAAKDNEIIGNRIKDIPGDYGNFEYVAAPTLKDALTDADFVVISILPGTFDEMESDVHTPEKYGIYQSVGDTSGPGGLVRALRALPMFEEIALAVKEYCPNAWVINYTNPMTVCVKMLYKTFPEIKAFGCCHEVFGTQKLLARVAERKLGLKQYEIPRQDIRVNVTGINHFTWLTEARYRNIDLFPIYKEFCEEFKDSGAPREVFDDDNWLNKHFQHNEKVKMNLFLRYGLIAAAGDRHLAEFCPSKWFLANPDVVDSWGFGLTPVSMRKAELGDRLKKSQDLASGKEAFNIAPSGEEGVAQMKAILGLGDLVTNVNIPNVGQIPNLPIGAVVETNAFFSGDSVVPMHAGALPGDLLALIGRVVSNQETIVEAVSKRDLELAFKAFVNDPLVSIGVEDARELFNTMVNNTASYLSDYNF